MTDSSFATLDNQRCTRVELYVPNAGAWHAIVDLETDPVVATKRCTLKIGTLTLIGSVVAMQSGSFGLQRKLRIVGGGGGWASPVAARAYHNDAGVKAKLIAEDVARAVGETLGQFVPASERLGNDYVRDSKLAASQILEDVIGGALWWVGIDGVTHVGQRPTAPALQNDSYHVLAYDPRSRVATLAVDDLATFQIGATISAAGLPEPQRVREYEVQVDAQGARVLVWCGGDEASAGRLAQLWRMLVERSETSALFGLYRYRVVTMAGDGRVSLQAVRKAAGLPDIEPISQWPGVAGVHAELTPGAEVLVAFVEGDASQPIITHYAGKGGTGFVPVSLTLGGASGLPAAKQNDTVEVLLPPAVVLQGTYTGTIGGLPATGVVVGTGMFPLQTTLGSITTGSSKVRVAP